MNKIIFMLAMILSSLSVKAKSTDWSKVGLYHTNKCNVYTFELSGVSDTNCMSYRFVEITTASSQVLLRKQNGSRNFSLTFPSKGKYYATVLIMNKCNGDDTLFVDTINVTCMPCDWSKTSIWHDNKCDVYKFMLKGVTDTCYKSRTIIYNKKTGSSDTTYAKNFTKVLDTGHYMIYVSILNTCQKCDTSFVKSIKVECTPSPLKKCDWSKIGFYHTNKCGKVTFELGSKDTCISYVTTRYNHKTGKLDTLSKDRVFSKYMDTGLYSFKTFFYNKCGKCDTFIYKPMVMIGCDSTSASVNPVKKDTDFTVAPNPGYDFIEIRYEGPEMPLFIYDPSGRIVHRGSTSDISIDVQSLSEGIYTITIGRTQKKIYIRR
jgi:hypothetical protein